MVNGINGKSSWLGSLRLNASLRQRHLMALQAGSCLSFKPQQKSSVQRLLLLFQFELLSASKMEAG